MKTLVDVGEFVAILELSRTDAEGNVLQHMVMRSNSFVRQFLDFMYILAAGIFPLRMPVTDITNVVRTVSREASIFGVTGGVGSNNGIVVGSSSTPVTLQDFRLGAQIAHGTGAGQLSYGTVVFGAPTTDGTICLFRVTRPFTNASGGSITIREIGMHTTVGGNTFLIIRDVVPSPIVLPNGQILTVNYQIIASI